MALRQRLTADDAVELAIKAVMYLAGEPERLSRFAGVTGFDASDARNAARQPGFLAGVLSYLLSDEAELLGFAEAEGIKPVLVPLAYRIIPGGDPTLEISAEAFR
jgi:hypothetical protein